MSAEGIRSGAVSRVSVDRETLFRRTLVVDANATNWRCLRGGGAVAAGLAPCGDDEASAPAQTVPSIPAVAASPYGASPTLRALGRQRDCSGFQDSGAFGRAAGTARGARSPTGPPADQLVTTEHRLASSNRRLKPGSRIAVGSGRWSGPLVEWRIAFISEGRIEVATAAFTIGLLSGGSGCFVSGTATVGERRR